MLRQLSHSQGTTTSTGHKQGGGCYWGRTINKPHKLSFSHHSVWLKGRTQHKCSQWPVFVCLLPDSCSGHRNGDFIDNDVWRTGQERANKLMRAHINKLWVLVWLGLVESGTFFSILYTLYMQQQHTSVSHQSMSIYRHDKYVLYNLTQSFYICCFDN